MTVWNINGKNFHRKYNINVAEDSANTHGSNITLTCLAYISYNLQLAVSSDIILGNNYGDIALVSYGKFLVVYPNAHNKMINCIKIVEAFENNLIIITSGDGIYIYIYIYITTPPSIHTSPTHPTLKRRDDTYMGH